MWSKFKIEIRTTEGSIAEIPCAYVRVFSSLRTRYLFNERESFFAFLVTHCSRATKIDTERLLVSSALCTTYAALIRNDEFWTSHAEYIWQNVGKKIGTFEDISIPRRLGFEKHKRKGLRACTGSALSMSKSILATAVALQRAYTTDYPILGWPSSLSKRMRYSDMTVQHLL